jgi:uncharacterized protein YjiS (DUF1127 family)
MSATSTLRHAPALPRLSVRGALDYIAALDARHRARLHLVALDDRMLADIGVTRAEVTSELRGALL